MNQDGYLVEAIASRVEAIATSNKDDTSNKDAIRWRPSLLGWRPSLLITTTR